MVARWEQLHQDILVGIVRRIKRPEDYVSFRGVCTSWRSAASDDNFMFSSIPLLMLAPREDGHVRDFYHPSKDTTQLLMSFQSSDKKYFSSKGYLISIGQRDLSVNIFDPFSCHQIRLPPLEKMDYYICVCPTPENNIKYTTKFITKCVLSSNPLVESDYTMMVIHGIRGELSYYRAGDETWTAVNTWFGRYDDVTFYKGCFYAVNCLGKVMTFNIGGENNPNEVEEVAELPKDEYWDQRYIVECAGELMIATKYIKVEEKDQNQVCTYRTSRFKVYNVDLSAKTCREVKDLGNRVLFLGSNSSFSCATYLSNCKPNSIYFTDDYFQEFEEVGRDMGIYSLQDESITHHFSGTSIHPVSPPTWIEQTFN